MGREWEGSGKGVGASYTVKGGEECKVLWG